MVFMGFLGVWSELQCKTAKLFEILDFTENVGLISDYEDRF